MTNSKLQGGLTFKQSIRVTEKIVVPAMSDFFTGFAEWTCIEALRPYLGENERTVGTSVNLSHSAATPVGIQVTAEVELLEVEERKLRFKIICRDEKEIISEGFHERFIINYDKFVERVQKKLS